MNAPRPASVKHTPMTEEEIICTMALTRLPRVNTATQHLSFPDFTRHFFVL